MSQNSKKLLQNPSIKDSETKSRQSDLTAFGFKEEIRKKDAQIQALQSELVVSNYLLDKAHFDADKIDREQEQQEENLIDDIGYDIDGYNNGLCGECNHSKIAHGIPNECNMPGKHMHAHDCYAVSNMCFGCYTCGKEHVDYGLNWFKFIRVCENCGAEYDNENNSTDIDEETEIETCTECQSSSFEEHELCSCEHWH